MHHDSLDSRRHSHSFGQDKIHAGEKKIGIVIFITLFMMALEIAAGIIFGSMALLADGLHMASHATALGISAFAYAYARRHAFDESFSFGTGKVNALGGFTGAIILAAFAAMMALESAKRIANPVVISYNQAILVAVIGFIVNGISVWILDSKKDHSHHHDHPSDIPKHEHPHAHDHNLRSAYLHVLADALTSILAIFSLLMAKHFGILWIDPLMGILGAVLISKWAWGLLKSTSRTLLDRQGPHHLRETIKARIENDGDSQITDLHLWAIGPSAYSVIISLVSHHAFEPEDYKKRIEGLKLHHVSIEISKCCKKDSPQKSPT